MTVLILPSYHIYVFDVSCRVVNGSETILFCQMLNARFFVETSITYDIPNALFKLCSNPLYIYYDFRIYSVIYDAH